jgi:RNA-binding protein 39
VRHPGASRSRTHSILRGKSFPILPIDPADRTSEFKQFGPGWIKQLEDEVKAECDVKYGKVVHIAVDPNTDGDIYVKFADVSGGEKALHGLNGRNFNFRTIRAESVIDKIYDSLYAAAATK